MKPQTNSLLTSLAAAMLSGLLLLPSLLVAAEKPLRIYGSGATFPAPLLSSWTHGFTAEHPLIQADYQGIGSAGGLKDLADGRVDFAAADFRLSDEEAAKLAGGVVQLPIAAAGIALIYNLPDVARLSLSREAIIGIFGGQVSRWNDPLIVKTNPEASLPDKPITLVTRVGASGTSYNLTAHLSAISPDLAKRLGTTLTPSWGTLLTDPGRLVRGSGNDGVTALVRAIPGSIGYVAYPYADFTKTPMAAIENKDGKLVDPSPAAFEASISSLSQSRTTATLIDPPGESAYPLIALSYLMLPKQHKDPAKQQAIAGIIRYALGPGQTIAERIGYIPFSPGAIDYVREELEPVTR